MRSLPVWSRVAIVVWAVVLVGVVGRVAFAKPRSQTVVPIYLAAAERWVNSESLYIPTPGLDLYRNPPLVAAAFAPFTALPEKFAGVVWRLLSVSVFLL